MRDIYWFWPYLFVLCSYWISVIICLTLTDHLAMCEGIWSFDWTKLRLRGVYSLTSCKDLMLCGGYEEQTPLKRFFSTKSMACLRELGWCPPCLILLLHSAFPTLGHHQPSLLPLEYLHLNLCLQQDDVIHTPQQLCNIIASWMWHVIPRYWTTVSASVDQLSTTAELRSEWAPLQRTQSFQFHICMQILKILRERTQWKGFYTSKLWALHDQLEEKNLCYQLQNGWY